MKIKLSPYGTLAIGPTLGIAGLDTIFETIWVNPNCWPILQARDSSDFHRGYDTEVSPMLMFPMLWNRLCSLQHLKHNHLHPAVIATNRCENPFHFAVRPVCVKARWERGKQRERERERRGQRSDRSSLSSSSISLAPSWPYTSRAKPVRLPLYSLHRPRRLPAESIIYFVVLFV